VLRPVDASELEPRTLPVEVFRLCHAKFPALPFAPDKDPAVIVPRRFSDSTIRWVGLLITASAVGFVAWSLYTSDLLATDAWMNTHVIVGVILAALIFTLSLCCVYTAWYLVVRSVSEVKIGWLEGFYIYSTSEIYKYVPSNIMHHVGRYYMLRRRGVEHSAASWGILAEMGLMVAASLLVALVFGTPLIRTAVLDLAPEGWPVLLGGAAIVIVIVVGASVALVLRRAKIQDLVRPFLRIEVLIAGLQAFLLQVTARTVSGFALWWLASDLLGAHQPSIPNVIAVWAAAWVAGYLTPGASAGLGVREAVIIGLFVGLGVPIEGATLVAIAFRVATTLGDLMFAGIGWASHYYIGTIAAPHHDLRISGE
jgi:uncharacterized membrane protein YbhN (UPF0104 family)